uniref:Uncharacterized protein n=1 Tax=Anguilla anguilla TaxID=7936 RepID=A0A0E9XGU9_ANGAN
MAVFAQRYNMINVCTTMLGLGLTKTRNYWLLLFPRLFPIAVLYIPI